MIVIGSDHGGYEMKTKILNHLKDNGLEVEDVGCYSNQTCDYPDIAKSVAQTVAKDDHNFGILVCGTGIGISIAANKIKGIRAACCHDEFSARLSRLHNDANVLCLGGRTLGDILAISIVNIFLNTKFEGDRHIKRINKIKELEK